ncbi:Transmembrane Fragile-X-F-associated protein [Rhynchospora pubera]|uniref:Transmembrane Fragile-X-F-associated protein n=1 Tax=Rhynchospora pubera TaxID=906938 RepID=A0AAV8CJJ1_9POAL|nr:Transmembrane Fragile-X-F-associated protein [Rhynchospora pubera]
MMMMMHQRRRPMTWTGVGKSAQAAAAHLFLFCFTVVLALKIDRRISVSWWMVFVPLWLFHSVVARGRFSLPAPALPHGRHWAPCHALVAVPLLVSFELLLCVYLQTHIDYGIPAYNLKIVFLPLLAFEVIILIDNFRMCRALMPGDEETMSDEAIWETLPHFWVAISMVFLIAATTFTLLKLSGDVGALGWWDLFINFGIAECFAFLVCTKWSNPMIHKMGSGLGDPCSSSSAIRYRDWESGLVLPSIDEQESSIFCGLQDIGGHIMKIPLVAFQILLCMKLEGTPSSARYIPVLVLFSPLFLLQGAGVLFATSRLVEKLVLLLRSGPVSESYMTLSCNVRDFFAFVHHGSRLLGWWSIDEGSKEEQARLFQAESAGYNTFCGYPPEIVKKMPKKDLAEEVWRLQAALGEQTEITKCTKQEYERLQNEKVLCRICYEGEICTVLIPCRHRTLCKSCSEKCKKCPICRVPIEERMPVFDV